jgi:hypothetical protein
LLLKRLAEYPDISLAPVLFRKLFAESRLKPVEFQLGLMLGLALDVSLDVSA